jgi:hypothetical protein
MVWTEGTPCAQMPRTTREICTEELLCLLRMSGSGSREHDEVFEPAVRNVVVEFEEEEHWEGDTKLSVIC